MSRVSVAPPSELPHASERLGGTERAAGDALIPVRPASGRSARARLGSEYSFVAQSRTRVGSGTRQKAPISNTLRGDLLQSSTAPRTASTTTPMRGPAAANDVRRGASKVPLIGRLVGGRYRIDRLLGEGGMGAVYLAHDMRLDIDVAVKLIRSELVCAQTRQRLLEEARATARVVHPSAVRVLDFAVDEQDCPFLVMELLAGRSLADALTEGVFSPEGAVRLLLPIIGAAAAAHAEGIVHRDIKPDNILLLAAEEGSVTPKLVDFGVARLPEIRGHGRITQAGALVGSPEYMAPEQTEGLSDVDARTDVWALCVVLYELVTGVTPFLGTSLLSTLALVRCDDPEPRGALLVEHELWWILRRGLAKEPCARWASAQELGRVLARWALARGIDADAAGTSISYWISRSSRPAAPAGNTAAR